MNKSIKILLVEDDPVSADLTKAILRNAGITNEIDVVSCGRSALAAMLASPPDVILLDWKLPDISGGEMLGEMQKRDELRSVSTIILSAHRPEQMGMSEHCAGPDYYISKPIDPMQFMLVLNSLGKFGFEIVNLERVEV